MTSLMYSIAFQFISLGWLGIQSFQQMIWHHPFQCLHTLLPVITLTVMKIHWKVIGVAIAALGRLASKQRLKAK